MCDAILLNVLFPHLAAVRVEELSDQEGVVCIRARAQSAEAACPACGSASSRVHGWYERRTCHHACLREPVPEADQPAVVADVASSPVDERRLVVRTQQRHAAIQQMHDAGYSICRISRELKLARGTVRRFLRANGLDELLAKTNSRLSVLDGFEPHLHRRWNEGCTDAARLFAEI